MIRMTEVSYDLANLVAVDINGDNVTAAVFVRGFSRGFSGSKQVSRG